MAGRRDAKLPRVILSERRAKAAVNLKLAHVPHPFTSREQYERAMARPIGREWNTAASVRATRVRVSLHRCERPAFWRGSSLRQHL